MVKLAIGFKMPGLFSPPIRAAVFGLAGLLSAPAAEIVAGAKPAAVPKRIVVPKLHGSVKIDGELDEPVWSKARLIKSLDQNDGAGPERERTELRLWCDEEALYLGWICQDSDIQATLTNRDDMLFKEEVVEFFVAPRSPTHYYEFEWNPRGAVFDAIIDHQLDTKGISKSVRGDWNYTAKRMQSAVKVKGKINKTSDKDEFWQVEIRLPFADLGQPPPKPKELWHANFHRISRAKGLPVEHLSWSPTLSSTFHQPSRFGILEFGE